MTRPRFKPVVVLALAVLATASAAADPSDKHPAYLRALADLRHARAHLERPAAVDGQTRWDEREAIDQIDQAMIAIRRAAIDDGKGLGEHPAVDAKLDYPGRLRRALDLLRQARAAIDREEDNRFAQGLKRRALGHVDRAIGFVEKGVAHGVAESQGKHPALVRALADLRLARAHVKLPVRGRPARWDEKAVLTPIDEAMRDIQQAGIDDGKTAADHPPLDPKLDVPHRLQRALQLLYRARGDVKHEPDAKFAGGLKEHTLAQVDRAIRMVEQGMAPRGR